MHSKLIGKTNYKSTGKVNVANGLLCIMKIVDFLIVDHQFYAFFNKKKKNNIFWQNLNSCHKIISFVCLWLTKIRYRVFRYVESCHNRFKCLKYGFSQTNLI